MRFLILRDAKGLAQVVIDDPALIERLAGLPGESVLAVTGTVVVQPQAPGGVELHQPEVEIISPACEPPPFDLFRPEIPAQLPTILDHAPLALRHPRQRALFQIAAGLTSGFRATLRASDFVEIQTPKLVATATEGGANVFPVDYFGRPAYLAQSPQFYKQIMVGVFERVFEVGPVFRAEPHDTPRHLNEYVSLDAEMGFIEDHTTVMQRPDSRHRGDAERVARGGAAGASDARHRAAAACPWISRSIHFAEAQELIAADTGEDLRGEPDLAPAHERWLGEWAQRTHGSDFLFVTGYPMIKRPFYTHPDPARPGYSRGFDLLFRGLELVTGGQRLHRLCGVPGGAGWTRHGCRAVCRLSGSVQAWDAATWRLCHWPGTDGGATGRDREHPRDDTLPARSTPVDAMNRSDGMGWKLCSLGGRIGKRGVR